VGLDLLFGVGRVEANGLGEELEEEFALFFTCGSSFPVVDEVPDGRVFSRVVHGELNDDVHAHSGDE